MQRSAILSPCGQYRYALERAWHPQGPQVLFIGLNPATADAQRDDATLRVCMGYARAWGYGGLWLGNLFAYRSRDPAALRRVVDPIGPENDGWLHGLQQQSALVVCAWGRGGSWQGRDRAVLSQLKNPHCLVQLPGGQPGHPLYKSRHLRPVPLQPTDTDPNAAI